jgi:hypothetical protein
MTKTDKLTSKLLGLAKEIQINYQDKRALISTPDKYFRIIEWVDRSISFLLIANPEKARNNPLIGKRWAITNNGQKELIDFIVLLTSNYPELEYWDFRNTCDYFITCLRSTAYKTELYNIDLISDMKPRSLFEIVVPDPQTWATNVLDIINRQIVNDTEDILFLMSLPCRIESSSFHLGFAGLRIINITEAEVLHELDSKYLMHGFSSQYFTRWSDKGIRDSLDTNIFIAIEKRSNKDQIFEYGKEFTDYFLSILVAITSKHLGKIHPSAKEAKSVVLTCFAKTSKNGQTMRVVDNPLFCPASQIPITPEILLDMRGWWAAYNSLCAENQSKIKNGLSFYIKGLIGTEMARFSNLYLFLDSVYGINGKVQSSIKSSILSKLPNYSEHLIDSFWEIRCDILHGGINRLFKWKGFPEFLKNNKVDPLVKLNQLCDELICTGIF